MGLRSGAAGYGGVTKALHWLTVLALLAQFTVGYVMDVDDSGRGRGRGRGGDSAGSGRGRGRGRGGDEALLDDPSALLTVHLLLGALIVTLAVVRIAWRRFDGLPPWAETLSPAERRLAHWTERSLLTLLFLVPVSGVVVLVADDLVWLHVGAHLAFFAALAAHVGLVLKHQLGNRDALLARMLW